MTATAAPPADELITLEQLIPHGQHVRPEHEGGAAGQSTAEERPQAAVHGVLKRFSKHERASPTPQALGWIKAVYANAIEYAGQKQALEGGILMGAFMFVPPALGGVAAFTWVVWLNKTWLSNLAGVVSILGGLLVIYWMTLFPLRHVWRTPKDLPVIFDRGSGRVYRMAQQMQPGLAGLMKPWPVKALSYEWGLLDAEHQSELVGSANSAMRLHRLVFVVRKSAQDPTIIDHFEIGNGLAQTPEMVAAMYEHIRRYMEEGGPPLPSPKEPLDSRPLLKPTWWQACGEAGPWGSRYGFWWKEHWPLAVMHHVMVAVSVALVTWFHLHGSQWIDLLGLLSAWISLSMVWGQGTGIWLMAHTSYLLDWPAQVHQAIGPAQRKGQGW